MRSRIVFFLSALVLFLIALLPLSLAISWFGLNGRGLAAREARGSLWAGTLSEASFGTVPLGDVSARLDLLPLLLGRARLSLHRDAAQGALDGAVSVSRHGFSLDDLTGQLRPGPLFAPLPLATLDLADLSARFENGRCDHAEGQVRAALSGEVAGMLSGAARCDSGALLLPLAGESEPGRLDLRIAGDGRWRIDLAADGFVRRIDGSF